MHRRVVVFALLVVGVLGLVQSGAIAQPTLDEVLRDIDDFGYYVEPPLTADFDELDDAVAEIGDEVVLVVLADNDAEAVDQVVEALGDQRSVVVVTPDFIDAGGAASDAVIQRGVDAFARALGDGDDYAGALLAFQAAVDPRTPAASASAADDNGSGGGGAGLLVFLLVVVAVIGVIVFLVKRKGRAVDDAEVERARAEIRSQLDIVAREILEHESEVEVRGNEQAIAFFREANATYTEVSEAVETTTNLLELAELNDEVDEARWQLEAAEAIMEGRPIPPEPEPDTPVACFFDPTHKPGTEECTIKTAAGAKEVRVCEKCAAQLERGERPEPRMIDVGGRRVPAAKAPRSHGGLGMGGLSAFEVILGGLGALAGRRRGGSGGGLGIDWGGGGNRTQQQPPRRTTSSRGGGRPSGGGVFGPDRTPERPRGLPRSTATRRPRTSSPRSGATGRGRARRRR